MKVSATRYSTWVREMHFKMAGQNTFRESKVVLKPVAWPTSPYKRNVESYKPYNDNTC